MTQPVKQRVIHHSSSYKSDALEVARDLCYDQEIIKKIKNAKSDEEISRILHDARNGKT